MVKYKSCDMYLLLMLLLLLLLLLKLLLQLQSLMAHDRLALPCLTLRCHWTPIRLLLKMNLIELKDPYYIDVEKIEDQALYRMNAE